MALSYFNQVIGGVSQLWVTDGTALGTHIDAPLGINTIFNLTTIGSRVFFYLFDPAHSGQELWTSAGTAAGTMMVKDINPGALTNFNGTVYFSANDGIHGFELWKSDGTA